MKTILFLLSIVVSVSASGYGSSGGYGNSGGFSNFGNFGNYNYNSQMRPLSFITGSSLSAPSSASNGHSNYRGQLLSAAIQSTHQVRYIDVPIKPLVVQPSTIQISSRAVPLMLLFKSASSQLNIRQVHFGSQGSIQKSTSEDQPHRLVQTITKPVIQEITEIISPQRRIVQKINPVQEEIQTFIARGKEEQAPVSAGTQAIQISAAVPVQVATPVETIVAAPVAPVSTLVPVSFVSQVQTQLAQPIFEQVTSQQQSAPVTNQFRAEVPQPVFTEFRRSQSAQPTFAEIRSSQQAEPTQISHSKIKSDSPAVESLNPVDRQALDDDLQATIRALQSQLNKNKDSENAQREKRASDKDKDKDKATESQ